MKCTNLNCKNIIKGFEEKDIHESHDVPCYLFEGNRKGRKNQADKYGRMYLCKECHDKYENALRLHLRKDAQMFAVRYFLKEVKEVKDGTKD